MREVLGCVNVPCRPAGPVSAQSRTALRVVRRAGSHTINIIQTTPNKYAQVPDCVADHLSDRLRSYRRLIAALGLLGGTLSGLAKIALRKKMDRVIFDKRVPVFSAFCL